MFSAHISQAQQRVSKVSSRFSSAKIFLLSFVLTVLCAPAATFGLVRLAYFVCGIDTERGLEALTLIGPERQAIVFSIALFLGILLALGARKIAVRTNPPAGISTFLPSFFFLFLSSPCLLLLDQVLYLHILDNPFPAARHRLMYKEGWGLLIFCWQLLFCLSFASGIPRRRSIRTSDGLSGVDRTPPSES